jgi:hypothetical protein
MVLGSLELPESDINGDTTLTLGLELVKNPGILERTLAKFGGFLLSVQVSSCIIGKNLAKWRAPAVVLRGSGSG